MRIISHRGNLSEFTQEKSSTIMLKNWKLVPPNLRVGLLDVLWQKDATEKMLDYRVGLVSFPHKDTEEETEIILDWPENSIQAIDQAMRYCDMVEVDLWKIGNNFYFGHDDPTYSVDYDYILENVDKLLLHCKNMDALNELSKRSLEFDQRDLHFFWHGADNYTLTSKGIIIAYPGRTVPSMGINMLPENDGSGAYNMSWQTLQNDCWGVCTDNPFFLLGETYE